MAKKSIFITEDLEWAEDQLKTWRDYIDDNPMHELEDRILGKKIVSKETQGKFIQDTMKNYLSLLEIVNNLREKDEARKQARGSGEIPHRMKRRR